MKKRIKKHTPQDRKLLSWVGFGGVIVVIIGMFVLNPFSPTGLAIHSSGSEEVTLAFSGDVPATSAIVYLVDGQEAIQAVTDLGFESYDVIDQNNQTIEYVILSDLTLNVSELGFELGIGEYDLQVSVENSDINLTVPLTVEEDVVPIAEIVSSDSVEVAPEKIDPASYIASLEDISQGAVIVGKPVKWKRVVSLVDERSDVNISLPPEAENINVKKVEGDVEVPVVDLEISDVDRLA